MLSFILGLVRISISLQKIRQIPCIDDITTAVYKSVGTVWEQDEIEKLRNEYNKNGLSMEVIESIPVHEDTKIEGMLI